MRNTLLALLASLAKIKAQKTSERTRAGMARAKAQGKRPSTGGPGEPLDKIPELAPISPLAAAALLLEVTQRAAALNTMPD